MTAAWNRLHEALRASVGRITALLQLPSLRTRRSEHLALIFTLLLLAIIATGLLAQHNADILNTSQRVVSHTYVVQRQIHTVETQLLEAEDTLRGYLLTGDSMSLAHYTADRPSLMAAITRLQILIVGDSVAQRQMVTMATSVATLLTEWQQAIDLRTQQRTDAAIASTRTNRVQQIVTSIHALLAGMDAAEERALAAQLRAVSNRASDAHVTMLVATAVDVVLLGVIVILVGHTILAREQFLLAETSARADAEEAVTLRDEFLSLASHELRTPIAILLLNIQLLERNLSGIKERDERVQQSFVVIHRQLRRVQTLISTMLDVSRLEGGRLKIAREPVDLVALVQVTVDELRSTAQTHPIELIFPVDSALAIIVCGDAVHLEQVMLNLLQNAIKYSPEGSPIRVKVEREVDRAVLSVTDHGIGISEDALPHVFEQFYRALEVRSEHIGGMGIGLYLVHEIVTLHGGEVSITSEHSVGTTVTVRLPLAKPHALSNKNLEAST